MDKNGNTDSQIMTRHQLHTELLRCEYCEEKPCKEACPVNCSPFDFIMAARVGNPSDIKRSAAEIMHSNPLGGVCGAVCPDRFCMAACSRKKFDGSINIPKVQATLVEMAKKLGGIPKFSTPALNGKKIAVVGGGPAGLGTAAALAQMGYQVDIFESRDQLGGMMNLIPDQRLDKEVVQSDIEFLLSLGAITAKTGVAVEDPKKLLTQGYQAVCVTTGLWKPIELGIENENLAIKMVDLLSNKNSYSFDGRVAVIGGGATAVDCAITAKERGATHVELFMLEKLSEMPLTPAERKELVDLLYGDFRQDLIRRMKQGDMKLDSIMSIVKLKDPNAGWREIGTPLAPERVWQFTTVEPQGKDILDPREGRRFRDVKLPAGLEKWQTPTFDASQWTTGKAPIGKGVFKPRGSKTFVQNRSVWGAGEFLLARTTFELDSLDYDFYRICVLANQGYRVFLNGKQISQYGWWAKEPIYTPVELGPNESKHLKKGTNVLAVYVVAAPKGPQSDEPVGQFDLRIEGLRKADLLGDAEQK